MVKTNKKNGVVSIHTTEYCSSEWTFQNYTYVSIEKRDIGKKDRQPKNIIWLFFEAGGKMNESSEVRHNCESERKEAKKTRIKYRKYEEHIIIFLHMNWSIAFISFTSAVSVRVRACVWFFSFIQKKRNLLVYSVYISSRDSSLVQFASQSFRLTIKWRPKSIQ